MIFGNYSSRLHPTSTRWHLEGPSPAADDAVEVPERALVPLLSVHLAGEAYASGASEGALARSLRP